MPTNQQITLSWEGRAAEYPLPEAYSSSGVAVEPTCSDRLEIRLSITPQGVIERAGFSLTETACPPIRAAAAYACWLCTGKTVFAASVISARQLIPALTDDGEPDEAHLHCLYMAELALKRAIIAFAEKFKKA